MWVVTFIFYVSEKFILFTWAILLLEKLLPYETSKWGIGFPLLWMIFRILIGHLHDDVVSLLRLESFRVLLSWAN